MPTVPLRWVLIRDPQGQFDPQALLCTDQTVPAIQIVEWFVLRGQLEVTFHQVRASLGVETQRQWSDLAITRTTPALLGLFSLVTPTARQRLADAPTPTRSNAWYDKRAAPFSDTLAFVREHLWRTAPCPMSLAGDDMVQIPRALLERFTTTLAYAA